MIAIIDYGCGNLYSLKSSLESLSIDCEITGDKNRIKNAERLILPGVGAFCDAMKKLHEADLYDTVIAQAKSGKYMLGICLGMQLLFDKSYEYGEHNGLSLIKGEVRPLADDIKSSLKIPHMGWNSLDIKRDDEFFKYIKNGDYMYFVHSYYATDCNENLLADADYEVRVPAVVKNGNVYGCQFHPEKSGEKGLMQLKAFCEL